jgi:uncharacterized protein (TIGR00251 family)
MTSRVIWRYVLVSTEGVGFKAMLREIKNGIQLSLIVQPNASKSEIIGEHNGSLKIRIKAPPVDGKANEAVESFISELFEVRQRQVTVQRGMSSRKKMIEVTGIGMIQAKAILAKWGISSS